ncbi:Glyoxylase, beta-lactamase superfamily II [Halorientalis persicus]|uniref:Glyoxylase, beta-lactamase superfamily II n=1 Tax=Halorientalis persicus TaxID=1367881 RepID=A0A1H8F840_9EURY|nr:MBL fold metallo-hydrolase [Halorientalis persicus]SEN27800.1 Glyoxylase, beta-lactamase superfamily II [Halorientalis persicus]
MDVSRVPVDTATRGPGGATNAYLLGSDDALLIDPAARTDALDEAVPDADPSHVAVTHHHPDHVGAVAEYADACDATLWARAGRADGFERATGRTPDRTFRPGDRIETDDGPVEIVDTPGHAQEHVAFTWDRGAVVGDLAVAAGSVVVGAPEGDMRAYLTSLRRLHARGFATLYPGHGPVIDDPDATLARLIDHRLDRERTVRRAVAEGARTVEEVLDGAYDKDLTGVRDLARATVRAHLEKLAVEGDLDFDGERAEP